MYPATFAVPEKYTPSSKPAFYFRARADLELVALLEWSTGFGSLCDTASNTCYTRVRAFPCAWVQLSFSAMPSGFAVWTSPGDVSEIQELRWRNLSRSPCGAEKLEEKETKSQAAFGLLIHSVASLFYYEFLLYHCCFPPGLISFPWSLAGILGIFSVQLFPGHREQECYA